MTPNDKKAADLALARKHGAAKEIIRGKEILYHLTESELLQLIAEVREQAKAEALDAAKAACQELADAYGDDFQEAAVDCVNAILALKDRTHDRPDPDSRAGA